ncbi:hypothetical protein, partial [Escherichia coli]
VLPGFTGNADFRFLLGGADSRDDQIIRQWTKQRLLVASIEQSTVRSATFLMTALNDYAASQALTDLKAAAFLDAQGYVAPGFSSRSDLSQ